MVVQFIAVRYFFFKNAQEIDEAELFALSVVSYIGLTISIVCFIATIAILIIMR